MCKLSCCVGRNRRVVCSTYYYMCVQWSNIKINKRECTFGCVPSPATYFICIYDLHLFQIIFSKIFLSAQDILKSSEKLASLPDPPSVQLFHSHASNYRQRLYVVGGSSDSHDHRDGFHSTRFITTWSVWIDNAISCIVPVVEKTRQETINHP